MNILNIGIGSDHGGYYLKEYLKNELSGGKFHVEDFGNKVFDPEDDFTDFIIPLARAVAIGEVNRGIAVCGSGVGACIAANKIVGIRSCLITDTYSAHQGVEDDNMNIICLGGRITGNELAFEIVKIFLDAKYIGAERHKRRLARIAELERRS